MEGGNALIEARGERDGDTLTVPCTRSLTGGEGDSPLEQGKTYNFGFAIHDGHPFQSESDFGADSIAEAWILDARHITGFDNHLVTVVGQYIEPRMKDGIWGGDTRKLRQHSLFVEDEWSVTDTVTLTGGLRYDNNDAFSGQWTPRVAAVWNATDSWTSKGGVGQGFRTPYLEQLSSGIIGFCSQGSVPLYGNASLDPERST